MWSITLLRILFFYTIFSSALPTLTQQDGRIVSWPVFQSLEELARIVDIAYCVGSTGIQKPFSCLSRCSEFPGFELVTTWNTGPLLSDSCGYIALSHAPNKKRVIVAFRGTYSLANTIADLSTSPAEYAPYPADGDYDSICAKEAASSSQDGLSPQLVKRNHERGKAIEKCDNCTVHSGFMASWRNTRCTIIPHVESALGMHPDYELTLVGHSLGGSVAALAGLEFQARGWSPRITTFGEPRIGNRALCRFIDARFNLNATNSDDALYRRVTHVDDPVPLLPLEEWGYTMHAGEIYISKPSLPPSREDIEYCVGDNDNRCIAGEKLSSDQEEMERSDGTFTTQDMWTIPKRYHLWQLFFAHRDYFWRLGLCLPGGDPWDWKRPNYGHGNENDYEL